MLQLLQTLGTCHQYSRILHHRMGLPAMKLTSSPFLTALNQLPKASTACQRDSSVFWPRYAQDGSPVYSTIRSIHLPSLSNGGLHGSVLLPKRRRRRDQRISGPSQWSQCCRGSWSVAIYIRSWLTLLSIN